MAECALIMPMAGRGSRFAGAPDARPKPLIELWGKPFFWWAAESARRAFAPVEMIFVVLEEHVGRFAIDKAIRGFYPQSRLVVLPDVTSGAAETAVRGAAAATSDGPILVNDCDHAFSFSGGGKLLAELARGQAGALLSFQSSNPGYSYVRLDKAGKVEGTVEKQVVGTDAIAGCYLFEGRDTFVAAYGRYRRSCTYDETYVSGIYNELLDDGGRIGLGRLDHHIPFGTPAEYAAAVAAGLPGPLDGWA